MQRQGAGGQEPEADAAHAPGRRQCISRRIVTPGRPVVPDGGADRIAAGGCRFIHGYVEVLQEPYVIPKTCGGAHRGGPGIDQTDPGHAHAASLHGDLADTREQLLRTGAVHDRLVAFAQCSVEFGAQLCVRLSSDTVGDVTDVALDDLEAFAVVGVADKFDVHQDPGLGFERQVVIPHKTCGLQFSEPLFAARDVGKGTDFPELLAEELGVGVAKHGDEIGVDVLNLGAVRIEEQDSILGSFKQAAIAAFADLKRSLREFARGTSDGNECQGGIFPREDRILLH